MPMHTPHTEFVEPPIREAHVTFRVTRDQLAVLDRYAAAAGESRGAFIRRALGALIVTEPTPGR